LINTSPGPGAGVGISSIRKGSANECKTAAFKVPPQRANQEETKSAKKDRKNLRILRFFLVDFHFKR
jgi:hypothetical protein